MFPGPAEPDASAFEAGHPALFYFPYLQREMAEAVGLQFLFVILADAEE
jgi:hypothetical protein